MMKCCLIGKTILYQAVRYGRHMAAKELLHAGADVNFQDNGGNFIYY